MAWLTAVPVAHAQTDGAEPKAGRSAESAKPVRVLDDGYGRAAGPHRVRTIGETVLRDPARGKELPVLIRAPRAEPGREIESFPLVVFSHGMGGSKDAFAELSEHWASHGYVVVHPSHSDSIKLRRERGEEVKLDETLSATGRARVEPLDRLADVKFILDSLGTIEERLDNSVKIDRERLGIAGHSAGAFTAQMAIGVRVGGRRFGAKRLRDFGDPRLKCAVIISGQGLTTRSLTKDSWAMVDRPMLVLAGSQDVTRVSDETPESRQHPYDYAKPGDKYLIYIEGAKHSSYSGLNRLSRFIDGEPTPDVGMVTDVTASGTLAFLDAYLLAKPEGKSYLQSDKLKSYSGNKVTLKHK